MRQAPKERLHKWLLIAFAAVALMIIVDAARANEGYVLVAGHVVQFDKHPQFVYPITQYTDNFKVCAGFKEFLAEALGALAGNNYTVMCFSESQLEALTRESGDPS